MPPESKTFFPNAHSATLYHPTLTNADTVNHYSTHVEKHFYNRVEEDPDDDLNSDPMRIYRKHIALDALFDADARFDPPKCHPDTRTAMLDHIDRWARDAETTTPILWLRGAAGAGKSAIAQTLSEKWDKDKILLATFFFWRTGSGRNEKRCLVPTIAHQLSLSIPKTRPHIEGMIADNVGIFKRNLRTQISDLVINPLMNALAENLNLPRIIVIDGLDECSVDYEYQNHEEQQREILEAIAFAAHQENIPLRFLISSRPERQIRESFTQDPLSDLTVRLVLDHTKESDADIELFTRCRFDEIKRTHPYLGASWPSEEVIQQLVKKSSGHFIYAAVVMRYLVSPNTDPETGLQLIMGIEVQPDEEDRPFAVLDALYTHIMNTVATRSLPEVVRIFWVLLLGDISTGTASVEIFKDIGRNTPAFLAKFLFLSVGKIYFHLINLHSLLEIPLEESSHGTPVTFIHASFTDYLTDPSRSGPYYIDQAHANIALHLLRLKHMFIMSLSSEKTSEEYHPAGFTFELAMALENRDVKMALPPSKDIAKGVLAFLTRDKTRYDQYVKDIHLGHMGFKRTKTVFFKFVGSIYTDEHREQIIDYLKQSGFGGNQVEDLAWSWAELIAPNFTTKSSPPPTGGFRKKVDEFLHLIW